MTGILSVVSHSAKFKKLLPMVIAVLGFGLITLAISQGISLQDIQSYSDRLRQSYESSTLLFTSGYSVLYITTVALSLPIASVLTVVAGGIFGPIVGSLVVIFSATVGSVVPFLLVRHRFGDYVQRAYPKASAVLVAEINKSENLYLLSARTAPLFPFYVINAVAGLSKISVRNYLLITAIGIVPGSIAYVYAGSQIEEAISRGSLVSPGLLVAFAAISILSFVVGILKRKQQPPEDDELDHERP